MITLDIDYFNPQIIKKFTIYLYRKEDIENDRPSTIKEITRFKKHYTFYANDDYVCFILQILFKSPNDRYLPIQSIDKILYLN